MTARYSDRSPSGGAGLPAEILAHWRLDGSAAIGDGRMRTWRVMRGGRPYALKHLGRGTPDWRYELRVAEAFHRLGWPTPEPAGEPVVRPDGTWVLFQWLPGVPAASASGGEERIRGRLLADLHAAARATGIVDQRAGFVSAPETVADPELDRWLAVHEAANPEEGTVLRRCRDASAAWFADNPSGDAVTSVIHGDFARWNLLFDGDRLSGVLDFEASHRSFQIADFALAWRGDHDDVIRGYEDVRRLSEYEWELLMPLYRAWLFIGVRSILENHYGDGRQERGRLELAWQMRHLRKRSDLLREKIGGRACNV